MMDSLMDQVALVTGAGSGIGRAIVLALAAQGATLVLVGRRPGPLEEVAGNVLAGGGQACIHPTDISREADIFQLADRVKREPGRCDILVHNAAFISPGPMAAASTSDFDEHYRTNVLGPFLLTQCLLPLLRVARGQIVFVNSSVGLAGGAGVGPYAASKHALKGLADSLRQEVNREGIRVLSVFPGRTATPTQERLHLLEGRPYRPKILLQPEDVAGVVLNSLCLPRTAEVTDVQIRPMNKWD